MIDGTATSLYAYLPVRPEGPVTGRLPIAVRLETRYDSTFIPMPQRDFGTVPHDPEAPGHRPRLVSLTLFRAAGDQWSDNPWTRVGTHAFARPIVLQPRLMEQHLRFGSSDVRLITGTAYEFKGEIDLGNATLRPGRYRVEGTYEINGRRHTFESTL
jgi:hypothetical protein